MINKGLISDGYHTFNELYEHRHALYVQLVNAYPDISWKSKVHHDGTSFEDYFICGMKLPTGDISYHLPMEYWDLIKCEELIKGHLWDGHTSHDVVDRLLRWNQNDKKQ